MHRLARELLARRHRGCQDWSGYDRLFPYLSYVYDIRHEYLLNVHDIPDDRIKWVEENTVCSFLIDPQGDVFYKSWGNNSGSGNTTCDNTSVNEFLGIYAMVCIDEDTSLDDIANEVNYHIYGDDETHAASDKYQLLCNEQFMREFAKKIGLELKFFRGGENYPLEQIGFLGYTYREIHGFWIPRFDDDKILFSLIHTYKTLKLDQFVSKVYSLVLLSFGTDIFPLCCRFFDDLLESVKNSTDPTVKSFVLRGVPTPSFCFAFYTQCEQSELDSLVQDIFGSSCLSGIKILC